MFYNIEDRGYGCKRHFTAVSYGCSNFYNIDYRKVSTSLGLFDRKARTSPAIEAGRETKEAMVKMTQAGLTRMNLAWQDCSGWSSGVVIIETTVVGLSAILRAEEDLMEDHTGKLTSLRRCCRSFPEWRNRSNAKKHSLKNKCWKKIIIL